MKNKIILSLILTISLTGYSQHQLYKKKLNEVASDINSAETVQAIGKKSTNKEKAIGDILWSEDFSNGINSWTTTGAHSSVWIYDLSGPGGQYTDNSISTSNHNSNAITSEFIISSPSVSNGFADFIADEYNTINGGVDLNASLVSPSIDLTGITSAELSFYQSFRVCCSSVNKLNVEISTNDFISFKEIDVMECFGPNDYYSTSIYSINLSNFLDTASNKSNFRMRFNWSGQSSYFWQIDDIVIKESSIEGAGVLTIMDGEICKENTTTVLSTQAGGTWSSSNNLVASVDANTGLVTGVGYGKSIITYTKSGETSQTCISIKTVPNLLPASISDGIICVGTTTSTSINLSGGIWISSDINIATISSNAGLVTGISSGTATLTYTLSGTGVCSSMTNTSSVEIIVNGIADAGSTSVTDPSICVGSSTTATSTKTGGTWSSSDNSIVTVDSNSGVVNGVTIGTGILTYTVIDSGICGGATSTSTVGVTVVDSGLETGDLSINDLSICEGNTTSVASTQPGGTWSSNDNSIVTVDPVSGLVSGIGEGNTTIIYTVSGSGLCQGSTMNSSIGVSVSKPNSSTIVFTIPSMISNDNGNYTLNASPNGGIYSGNGVSGNLFDPASSGLGNVNITYSYNDISGCSNYKTISTIVYDTTGTVCTSYVSISVTDTLIMDISLAGLNGPDNVNTMKVYPNPSNDVVTIDNGNYALMNGYSIKIININAQEVFNSVINSQIIQIPVSQLGATGNYFINIYDNNLLLIESKILVLQ